MLVESSSKVILAMKIRDSRITNSKIGDEVKIKAAKVVAKKTKPPVIYNGSKAYISAMENARGIRLKRARTQNNTRCRNWYPSY
jgi:DNA topoisomerase IA